ncbi:hypothetical protein ZTR_09973 [Talaromyces verruculosus]|nr:hypothetical protein ZTR_09973 [Talaromyces verruculosus]
MVYLMILSRYTFTLAACVIPRPIGWISTRSKDGQDNLAPYSQFNNLTFDPPYVMFSSNMLPPNNNKRKDTVVNAEETKHFVWNLATWDLREAVNITGEYLPHGVDEFERASQYISKEPATLMDVSMVKESPVKFECAYHSTIRLPGNPPMGTVDIVIGKVVAVHIKDEVLTDGLLDVRKTLPIARCGYHQYTVVRETFDMIVPGNNELMRLGMEGNAKATHQPGQQEEKNEA